MCQFRAATLACLALLAVDGCRCTPSTSIALTAPTAPTAPTATAPTATAPTAPTALESPRRPPQPAPPDVEALERAFATATAAPSALLAAERLKCGRLAARLARFGALLRRPASRLPALPAATALLSFVVHGGQLHRFVRLGAATRRLPAVPLTRLDGLLIGARDAIEYGPLLDVAPLWQRLRRAYETLLGAARPELDRARRLVVAVDGLLQVVPVHALVWSESPLRFVIERWDVAYTPCALLGRSGPLELRRATLLAPAYGRHGERRPLAGARAESVAMASTFRGAALCAYRDAAATPQQLLAALRRPLTTVHFAGHGLADLRPGSPPELLFPDVDPGVTVRALGIRPTGAELVVLASCTGAYAARFRDDRRLVAETNPAEALLAGGARTVIAASWSVKDRQSAVQLATFYRELRVRGPCGALAAAQRERSARLRPPHPRFWAFYACYGDLGVAPTVQPTR